MNDIPCEAVDLMALNSLDTIPKFVPTLAGLRSAAAVVIDTAARRAGTSRADAHARLWPKALDYASRWPIPAEDDRRRLADFMDHCADQTIQDEHRVQTLVYDLARPRTGTRPSRAPQALVRLLAGAVPWLPLLHDPRQVPDMSDLAVLPVGLLLMDALAERGLHDTAIDNDDGRAVEHVSVGSDSLIGICTKDETVSRTPAASTGFLVEYAEPGAGYPNLLEFTAEPVTPRSITVVADAVAALARELGLS